MKVVETILYIRSSEPQCVILEVTFQSEQLEQHISTIGLYQLLSKSALYEHKRLENIKKL